MAQFYTKINTLFKRYGVNETLEDNRLNNCIKIGEYTDPEVELLKDLKWKCTEKVDGINTSIELCPVFEHIYDASGNPTPFLDKDKITGYEMNLHGKTENANIPKRIIEKMNEYMDKEKFIEVFTKRYIDENGNEVVKKPDTKVEVFGECYGSGICGGGRYIRNGVDFIVFDVRIGDTWLKREACEDIAEKLGMKIVPLIGYMTIPEATEYVKKGFKSLVAEDKTLDAEGLVCEAPLGMLNRLGRRIITKIKTCDFRELERKMNN